MTETDYYRRRLLREALVRALRWESLRITNRDGTLTDGFVRHLDAILSVHQAAGDIKSKEVDIFYARYRDGLEVDEIAQKYRRKCKTVRNILYRVMGTVMESDQLAVLLFNGN